MEDEKSIFDEIPQKVYKDEDELIKKAKVIEPKEMVYQLCEGENEYYTFDLPVLGGDTICATKLIKKGILTEKILNEVLEQFYKQEFEEITFELEDGLNIKQVSATEINWLKTTKEEAELKLKDDVLIYYETVVPQLLKRVSSLEAALTTSSAGSNQRPQQQRPQERGPNRINNNLLL